MCVYRFVVCVCMSCAVVCVEAGSLVVLRSKVTQVCACVYPPKYNTGVCVCAPQAVLRAFCGSGEKYLSVKDETELGGIASLLSSVSTGSRSFGTGALSLTVFASAVRLLQRVALRRPAHFASFLRAHPHAPDALLSVYTRMVGGSSISSSGSNSSSSSERGWGSTALAESVVDVVIGYVKFLVSTITTTTTTTITTTSGGSSSSVDDGDVVLLDAARPALTLVEKLMFSPNEGVSKAVCR